MKEYSQRTVLGSKDIGEYLTARAKEGWDVLHIQKGVWGNPNYWHIILVRDPTQTFIVRDPEQEEAEG